MDPHSGPCSEIMLRCSGSSHHFAALPFHASVRAQARGPSRPFKNAGFGRRSKNAKKRRSEEHTSELQSLRHLVCRLLLGKKTTSCLTIFRKSTNSIGSGASHVYARWLRASTGGLSVDRIALLQTAAG